MWDVLFFKCNNVDGADKDETEEEEDCEDDKNVELYEAGMDLALHKGTSYGIYDDPKRASNRTTRAIRKKMLKKCIGDVTKVLWMPWSSSLSFLFFSFLWCVCSLCTFAARALHHDVAIYADGNVGRRRRT